MLTVTIQKLEDAAVLRCAGRIVAGDEAAILRNAVLSQLKKRTIVLDLAQVATIDGGGLGLLIFLQASAVAAGTELKLVNLAQPLRELLRVTNLDSVFDAGSEDDGLSDVVSIPGDAVA